MFEARLTQVGIEGRAEWIDLRMPPGPSWTRRIIEPPPVLALLSATTVKVASFELWLVVLRPRSLAL